MPKMILLVGPPGSGKSTLAKKYETEGFVRISQDDQGKQGHQDLFRDCIKEGKDVIVDRMGFNKQQRFDYLHQAKVNGYETEIIVIHESYETCLARAIARQGHPTIKDETNARAALQLFFTKYERPEEGEADKITFVYPDGVKLKAIWSDLDGTLANCEHRRHFVRPPDGTLVGPTGEMVQILGNYSAVGLDESLPKFKKDWKSFFDNMDKDTVNTPVMEVLHRLNKDHEIVYCTGRPDSYEELTKNWLNLHMAPSGYLFMRNRHDSRSDDVIKEIMLDFEVKTRFDVVFCLDDRNQVVNMLRGRGMTVFQVADGDF